MIGVGLRLRQRVGLTFAIIALALSLSETNRHVRLWLRDDVLGGLPFWLDNMLIMVALVALVWGMIGLLVLGPRDLGLGVPERRRQAWPVAVASGVALVGVVALALAASGALVVRVHVDWPLIMANVVSNLEEELVHRGAILGLLLAVLGRERSWLAAAIGSGLFCFGHRHYPLPLLLAVFGAGMIWSGMTIRYRSIWPAWLSHTVVDAVADSLFKT